VAVTAQKAVAVQQVATADQAVAVLMVEHQHQAELRLAVRVTLAEMELHISGQAAAVVKAQQDHHKLQALEHPHIHHGVQSLALVKT
jgi:hypothetical protein